jgi:hypothetical protein
MWFRSGALGLSLPGIGLCRGLRFGLGRQLERAAHAASGQPQGSGRKDDAELDAIHLDHPDVIGKPSPTGSQPDGRPTNRVVLACLGLVFQPLYPSTSHFADVLWRGSPIAHAAFHRIFNAQDREDVCSDARLNGLHGLDG